MNITPELLLRFSCPVTDTTGQKIEFLQALASLASGTSTGQMDVLYADQRTVTNNSTPDTIDLRSGTIIGSDRTVASFVKVGMILVANYTIDTTFTVGQGSNPFATWAVGTTPGVKILPAQLVTVPSLFLLFASGTTLYTTTAATGDILQVASDNAAARNYTIVIMGRSA